MGITEDIHLLEKDKRIKEITTGKDKVGSFIRIHTQELECETLYYKAYPMLNVGELDIKIYTDNEVDGYHRRTGIPIRIENLTYEIPVNTSKERYIVHPMFMNIPLEVYSYSCWAGTAATIGMAIRRKDWLAVVEILFKFLETSVGYYDQYFVEERLESRRIKTEVNEPTNMA